MMKLSIFARTVGFEYTPDVNTENDNMPPWGHSDMEALGNQIDLNLESTSKNGFWKYEEDLTMKEVRDYLSGTTNPTTLLKSLRLRLLTLSKVLVMQNLSVAPMQLNIFLVLERRMVSLKETF